MKRLSLFWKWALLFLLPTIAIAGFSILVARYPFLTFGVTAFTTFALMATYQVWLWWLLRKLARRNIVVTNVQEGTGKLILKNGKASRGITAHHGTDPEKKTWSLTQADEATTAPPDAEAKKTEAKKTGKKSLLTGQDDLCWLPDWIDRHLLPGGMRWKGFEFMGYELYLHNFRWEVLRESEPSDKEDALINKRKLLNGKWVASFAKKIDYIYLKDAVYYFEVNGAETKCEEVPDERKVGDITVGMPVDVQINATVRITNFYLALIMIHDWLQSSFNLVEPSVRGWIAESSYTEIISKPEVADRKFDPLLKRTGVPNEELAKPGDGEKPKMLVDYLELSYGVRFKRLGVVDVIPPDEYTRAAIAREKAKQDKIRIRINAEADAAAIEIKAGAEANRINTVNQAIKGGGETALRLRELEALEVIGESGNVFVVNTKKSGTLINLQKDQLKGKGGKEWDSSQKSEPPSEKSKPA